MKSNHQLALSIAWLAGLTFIAGCCCCQAPEPPSNGVQIQVDVSNLSDAEIEDLKAKLTTIAGNDSNVSTVFNGQATWNYPTDLEPQAFADQIDFATVDSVVDRVITLSVSSPASDDGNSDGADTPSGDGEVSTDDGAVAPADDGTDDGAGADSAADGEAATDAGT